MSHQNHRVVSIKLVHLVLQSLVLVVALVAAKSSAPVFVRSPRKSQQQPDQEQVFQVKQLQAQSQPQSQVQAPAGVVGPVLAQVLGQGVFRSTQLSRIGQQEAVQQSLGTTDCPSSANNAGSEESSGPSRRWADRWSLPLVKVGDKHCYIGMFFKANWYRAAQFCRYHDMHLVSIGSQEENDELEKHIRSYGLGNEHFWTSGTDQAVEGSFFWMANGKPFTFENWNVGEPNNFRYENGEEEHCLELWNRDGKGMKWNDSPCSFETFFVCEVHKDSLFHPL